MPDHTPAIELQSMIEDVKEHLSYLRELGVSAIDPPIRDSANKAVGAIKKSNANRSASFASLRRNALAADEGSEAPTAGTSPNHFDESHSALDSTKEMATSKRTPPQKASSLVATLFDPALPSADANLARSNETLEDVWRDTQGCTRCPLWEGRTNVVNSEGNRKAQLMFVGEAPGADEDAQARPFVGRAGQLLHKIIESIGLKRDDVFIGNVNRCRPPQNRTPTQAEGGTCKPFILREIDIVQPKVIVVLGNVAMKNLLGTKEGITKVRGKFQDYRGIKVMPTFHPAYLLRDPSKKRETWEDMKKVRDYLNSTSD